MSTHTGAEPRTAKDVSPPGAPSPTHRRAAWPWWATAAGLLGFTATILTDSRPPAEGRNTDYTVRPEDVLTTNQSSFFMSMVIGYAAVVALLVFAAAWRRHAERRASASTAVGVVTLGLTACAGALALAYGWRGALGNYLPGGIDEGAYDVDGLWVYFMLNDFGSYIAWMPMLAVSGAVAWLAFRERLVPRWIGAINAAYVLLIGGAVVATGVPGLPGTLGHLVLAVTGTGLALSRRAPLLHASVPNETSDDEFDRSENKEVAP
jgi:hypothetical protein